LPQILREFLTPAHVSLAPPSLFVPDVLSIFSALLSGKINSNQLFELQAS